MTIERYLRLAGGLAVLISLLLAQYVNHNWIYFTYFVGINLVQSAFTNWCPFKSILKFLNVKECSNEGD